MENNDTPLGSGDSVKVGEERVVTPAFGLGRWAPFQYERDQNNTMVRPFFGRILLWLLVLVCVGWAAVSGGVYVFVKYKRGFTEVRYVHLLLLPWKIEDYRRAKGEFWIKKGMENAGAQKWREALEFLSLGLKAVPENKEARLMVARIYLMAGRSDLTRTTLIDGLKYHGDQLAYLRDVIGFFFGLEADTTLIELMSELRPRLSPSTPAGRMAVTALAYACFNRGRYKEAVAALKADGFLETLEGRFVTARIDWEEGRHDEALVQLRELTLRAPDNNEFYRAVITVLREDRQWGAMRRASLSRQLVLPDNAEAYLDYIEACGAEADESARAGAEKVFFERFANDTQALLLLGERAAAEGRLETVNRVVARCRALGRDEVVAVFLLMEVQLVRRSYDDVLSTWYQSGARLSKEKEPYPLMMDGLRAAALFGLGQDIEAEQLAGRLCLSWLLPVPTMLLLVEQWERVGKPEAADRLLRHAMEIDPLNRPAVLLGLRIALKYGEMDKVSPLVVRLVAMRKPPFDVLHGVAKTLQSDLYLYLSGRSEAVAAIKNYEDGREREMR
jgi:tetratricopeptide (TPR) repeat protein